MGGKSRHIVIYNYNDFHFSKKGGASPPHIYKLFIFQLVFSS
ncbi:hypothetical protein B4147_3374 [Bacillus wiedmannii]|uniref:Uncharacterized protein n=1 Tax=Bacillus wiedmannii TaxID=1890302 RepID=A0A0G8CIC3_9BACI|nr:hypothetical protein B4147_3374 [Bacillus wiedmannii]